LAYFSAHGNTIIDVTIATIITKIPIIQFSIKEKKSCPKFQFACKGTNFLSNPQVFVDKIMLIMPEMIQKELSG